VHHHVNSHTHGIPIYKHAYYTPCEINVAIFLRFPQRHHQPPFTHAPLPTPLHHVRIYTHTHTQCVYIYKLYTHLYIFSFAFFLLPLRYYPRMWYYTYTHFTLFESLSRRRRRSFGNTFPSRNVMTQHRRRRPLRIQWTSYLYIGDDGAGK